MNLFGVGILEMAVIFLVAFLVMGPARTIEMARSAGKLIGDLRRTVNEMTAAADLSDVMKQSSTPPAEPPTPQSSPPSPRPPSAQDALEPPAGAVPTTGPGEGNEQQP